MSDSEQKLRQAMMRIAEMSQAAVDSGQYMDDDNGKPYGETARRPHTHAGGKNAHCSIKQLPGRLAEKAAKTAMSINPVNRVNFGPMERWRAVLCSRRQRSQFWLASIGASSHGGSRSALWMADQVTFAGGSLRT